MELIALRSMTYAGRRLSSGDRFIAPTSDARVLVAIKKAEFFIEPAAAADDGDKGSKGKKGKN